MYTAEQLCHYCEFDKEEVLVSCNKMSIKNNYACNDHEAILLGKTDEYCDILKKYFVENVKEYLDECEMTIKKANKAIIAKKIYDFIIKYPLFLIKQPKFLATVQNKLTEFTFEDPNVMGDFIVSEYKIKLEEIIGNTKPIKNETKITKKLKRLSTKSKEIKVKINTRKNIQSDDTTQNFIIDASNYVIDL